MSLPRNPNRGLLPDDVHVQASTKQVPLPRVDCRPHPQATKLIPPAVRVLILGIHLQHWRSHLGSQGHGISSPRGWARLGGAVPTPSADPTSHFFPTWKKCEKTIDLPYLANQKTTLQKEESRPPRGTEMSTICSAVAAGKCSAPPNAERC